MCSPLCRWGFQSCQFDRESFRLHWLLLRKEFQSGRRLANRIDDSHRALWSRLRAHIGNWSRIGNPSS